MVASFIRSLTRTRFLQILTLVVIVFFLLLFWVRGGFDTKFLDSDLGRDLFELSNIWIGRIVWLGPRLGPGLHASPLYYYMFYPFLWLSGGNAHALLVGNLMYAMAAVLLLGLVGFKKWGWAAILVVLNLGFSPWWRDIVLHPGNGFTYPIWLVAALVALWFELPLVIAALLMGIALAYHPATIFALVFLLYEWWRRGHGFLQFLLISAGLIIPWTPIIVFEIITKGYIIRHWLERPASGITTGFSVDNLQHIAFSIGLPLLVALTLGIGVLFLARGRVRIWVILTLILLFIVSMFEQYAAHYLFGITAIVWFTLMVVYVQKPIGQIILAFLVLFYIHKAFYIDPQPIAATRPISRIETVVNVLSHRKQFALHEKLAVVAIMDTRVSVPQADDYRFFFRMKGYEALDIAEYPQADVLILFVEEPTFAWEGWSSWEMDQFGARKISYQETIDDIQVVVYRHP